jgi:hypothetical protein
MRQPSFGTADEEVLLKLAPLGSWNRRTGRPLYDCPAMTEAVCQKLVRHGFLREKPVGLTVTYTVTAAGENKAAAIRQSRTQG